MSQFLMEQVDKGKAWEKLDAEEVLSMHSHAEKQIEIPPQQAM